MTAPLTLAQAVERLAQAIAVGAVSADNENYAIAPPLTIAEAKVILAALLAVPQEPRDYTPDELCAECGVVRPCFAHDTVVPQEPQAQEPSDKPWKENPPHGPVSERFMRHHYGAKK